MMLKYFLAINLLFLTCGCVEQSKILSNKGSDNFKFIQYGTLSADIIPVISNHLEINYSRILDDFNIANLPTITVKIWKDNEEYLEAQEKSIGQRYPGSTGYVSRGELRLLDIGSKTKNVALHEFVHHASFVLNPTIGNNPRWLWEAIAIYQSNNPEFNPNNLQHMYKLGFPSLIELNQSFNESTNIYNIGFTLVEYINVNWGFGAVIKLIKTNGDFYASLKITEKEFEKGWHDYLRRNYINI